MINTALQTNPRGRRGTLVDARDRVEHLTSQTLAAIRNAPALTQDEWSQFRSRLELLRRDVEIRIDACEEATGASLLEARIELERAMAELERVAGAVLA